MHLFYVTVAATTILVIFGVISIWKEEQKILNRKKFEFEFPELCF